MAIKTILVAGLSFLYYRQSMTPRTAILIENHRLWMKAIVIALNSESPLRRAEIRRLVEAWQASGRNVEKMLRAVPELKTYLWPATGWPPWHVWPFIDGSGLGVTVMPEGSNVPGTRDERIRDEARLMFLQLLLNPERDRLSERPCARCDNYFQKKYEHKRVYCSRKCGKDGTAAFATTQRLQKQRGQKLRVAVELASKWTTARTKDDWKQWVSKQPAGVKEEITPKFLTRAVNHYGIKEPKKEK